MRKMLITSALLLIVGAQSYAQCPECRCGCPCDPGFNWYDWSAIDFTTGLPFCVTSQSMGCCSPFDLYYARSIGGWNRNAALLNNGFQYPFPFANGYPQFDAGLGNGGFGFGVNPGFGGAPGFGAGVGPNGFGAGVAPNGFAPNGPVGPNPAFGRNPGFAPAPGFGPRPGVPCGPGGPGPFGPATAPIMHTPKAGPPVVDAVDPFSVSSKEPANNVSNNKVTSKPAEFELPRVSGAESTVKGEATFEITLPTPPETSQPERTIWPAPTPRRSILPLPRFVPSRGSL